MRKTVVIISLLIMGLWANSAFAALSDTVDVTATILAGTSELSIAEASVAFGNITPTSANHRFSAGPFTVSYFAASSPWTIRIYTDNHSGIDADENAYAGLEGADGTSYVPLRLWNENRSAAGVPPASVEPDPEIDANWNDPVNGVWSFIVEKDAQTTVSDTWCRLAYKGAELNDGFVNYLALDAQGTKPQAYTTTLTVEIINQ